MRWQRFYWEPENSGIRNLLLDSSYYFNKPLFMMYSSCAVYTDPHNLISYFITSI